MARRPTIEILTAVKKLKIVHAVLPNSLLVLENGSRYRKAVFCTT